MKEILIKTAKPFYLKHDDSTFKSVETNSIRFVRCYLEEGVIKCTFYGDNIARAEKEKGYQGVIFAEIYSTVTLEGQEYPCIEYKFLDDESLSHPKITNQAHIQAYGWGYGKYKNHLYLTVSCFTILGREFFDLTISYRNEDGYRNDDATINNYGTEAKNWQKVSIPYYHPAQQLFLFLHLFRNNNPLAKEGYPVLRDFIPYVDSKREDFTAESLYADVEFHFVEVLKQRGKRKA